MSPVLETMAMQSALLRHDVNRAAYGGELPREKTMPDNRPMVKLREHLLGLGGEEVVLDLGGRKYLLVAPSEKKAGQILDAATRYTPKKGPDGLPLPSGEMEPRMDVAELKVRALQACLFDPDTRQPELSNELVDLEALRNAPVNAIRRRLMEESVKLISPNLKDVEKNSSPAPGTSASTASPQS